MTVVSEIALSPRTAAAMRLEDVTDALGPMESEEAFDAWLEAQKAFEAAPAPDANAMGKLNKGRLPDHYRAEDAAAWASEAERVALERYRAEISRDPHRLRRLMALLNDRQPVSEELELSARTLLKVFAEHCVAASTDRDLEALRQAVYANDRQLARAEEAKQAAEREAERARREAEEAKRAAQREADDRLAAAARVKAMAIVDGVTVQDVVKLRDRVNDVEAIAVVALGRT